MGLMAWCARQMHVCIRTCVNNMHNNAEQLAQQTGWLASDLLMQTPTVAASGKYLNGLIGKVSWIKTPVSRCELQQSTCVYNRFACDHLHKCRPVMD